MPELTDEFFTQAAVGHRTHRLLMTATRLEVFDVLAEQPLDGDTVAARLGCAPRTMDIFLRALVAIGLLELREGRFANTAFAERRLVSTAPGYAGYGLRFSDRMSRCWDDLEEVLRTGAPEQGYVEHLMDDAAAEDCVRGMIPISAQAAQELPRLLGDRPLKRILDVGAGPGVYTVELLRRHPGATATLVDLASSQRVARRLLEGSDVRERISFEPGDYREVDFGSGYDLVLMSHVVHDEPPEVVQHLFRKAHECLEPGGRLAVHDWVVDEDGCGPLWETLFSINLMLFTPGGRLYSKAKLGSLIQAAGFSEISEHQVPGGGAQNPTRLILGSRS